MSFLDEFKRTLLPGNYALTKSMELTRINNSGTLWYTKKFLTLYYYIFLSNEIMTHNYIDKVIEEFDRYIDGLDDSIKPAATAYFYPEHPAINFKSPEFNSFASFASHNEFATQAKRIRYYKKAKKYYFALLMGSGGQSGIKKKLKESVQRTGFIFSEENIISTIISSAIQVCVEEANRFNNIRDNSIQYILSSQAIAEIIRASYTQTLTITDVEKIVQKLPKNNPNYNTIANDMIAFIRNERQLLYYYGYFHSKSSGAHDFEFSSLTPIGELALKANAKEFLAIWEHQKVKMISQPPIVKINLLRKNEQGNLFAISYSPYTDIISHLKRRATLSPDEYKYLVSRKKHIFSDFDWGSSENDLCLHIQEVKAIIRSFGRNCDITNYDSQKELKKYLLGIRSDLPVDNGTNIINACKLNRNSKVEVTNTHMIDVLYSIYSKLDQYKLLRYENIFAESETDLRRRYIAACSGERLGIDPKVKIHWDLYNIHADKFIIMGTMLAIVASQLNINSIEDLTTNRLSELIDAFNNNFNGLLRSIGINTNAKVKKELLKAINALKNADYRAYMPKNNDDNEQVIARYREIDTEDLFAKIVDISSSAVVTAESERKRNVNLVSMLKSYYIKRFSYDNQLICECCGQETFITEAGEPYVEFHHVIPFNIAYGPDHYLNLYALCPNCHRKIHFMHLNSKADQYHCLDENNYLQLGLRERLTQLKAESLLRSYHLEYLLADHAITEVDYNAIIA